MFGETIIHLAKLKEATGGLDPLDPGWDPLRGTGWTPQVGGLWCGARIYIRDRSTHIYTGLAHTTARSTTRDAYCGGTVIECLVVPWYGFGEVQAWVIQNVTFIA